MLLHEAAERFCNHGCDEFEIPEDAPGPEVRELVLKVIDDPGFRKETEEMTNNQLRSVLADHSLMGYYSGYLGEWARYLKRWETELKQFRSDLEQEIREGGTGRIG